MIKRKGIILKEKINKLNEIQKNIRFKKALTDPWMFLTGYRLGTQWTPGESKGWAYTLDEHDAINPIKRFPNKEYLWYLTRYWLKNEKVIIAKSRRMIVTWLFVSLHLWLFLSRAGQLIFFQSKTATDSNALIEKANIIYDNLDPMWHRLIPAKRKYLTIYSSDRYSKILGVPQTSDALRQYTASAILSDEGAFQENAEEAYVSAKPTIDGGGRYTIISSANGENNFFYHLYSDNIE